MDESADDLRGQVKICVRQRPFLASESAARGISAKLDPLSGTVECHNAHDVFAKTSTFKFAHAFGRTASTEELFTRLLCGSSTNSLLGGRVTVVGYGQSGSGKSYTVDGLLLLSFASLMTKIEQSRQKCAITVSYLELFHSDVHDLFDFAGSADLLVKKKIRKDTASENFDVQNLIEKSVGSFGDFEKIWRAANKRRKIAHAAMGIESSRCHTLVRVMVSTFRPDSISTSETPISQDLLTFVDLAGSERFDRERNTKLQTEARSISRSLLALSNILSSLTTKKHIHVPFRDSKLTMLLKTSLDPSLNTRCILIGTIGPSLEHFAETESTLQFLHRINLAKTPSSHTDFKNTSFSSSSVSQNYFEKDVVLRNNSSVSTTYLNSTFDESSMLDHNDSEVHEHGYTSKLEMGGQSLASSVQVAKLLLEQGTSDYYVKSEPWAGESELPRKKRELTISDVANNNRGVASSHHHQSQSELYSESIEPRSQNSKRYQEQLKCSQSVETNNRDLMSQLESLNAALHRERAANMSLNAEKTELQTALDTLTLGVLTTAECSETKTQSLQGDHEALQVQLRESRSEMRALRSDLAIKDAELNRLKQLNSSLSGSVSGSQDDLVQAHQHQSQLASRLATKEKECETLSSAKMSLQSKLSTIEKSLGASEAQLSARSAEVERLKLENGELKAGLADKEQAHKKLSKSFAELLRDFSSKDDDLLAGVKVQNELKGELAQIKTQHAEMTTLLAEAETNATNFQNTIASLRSELATKAQSNVEIGSRSSQQKEELANLMRTISDLQADLVTSRSQNDKHAAKVKEQQSLLESAEATRMELKTHIIHQDSKLSQLVSQVSVSEGKAKECQLFAERVNEKEKSLLNLTEEFTAAQQIMIALENELRSTKARKEDLVMQMDERDAQLTDVTGQLQRAQAECADSQLRISGLGKQVFKLEQSLATLEPEVDRVRLALTSKDRECTKANDTLGQVRRELEALQLLHTAVEEKLTGLQTMKQGLKVESSKLRDDYQSLQISLAQEQRHNRELMASENRLKADIMELNHEMEQLGLGRSDIEKRLFQKTADYAALQTENCQLSSKLEASEKTCQSLHATASETANQSQETQRINQQLQAQLADKEKELGTLNSQCTALRTTLAIKEREGKEALHREELHRALVVSKDSEISQLHGMNKQVECDLRMREEELRQTSESRAQTANKLSDVSDELKETKEIAEKQMIQLNILGQSNTDSLNQLQTMDQEFRSLLSKHQQVQQQRSDFAAEIDELQKRLETEQKLKQKFETEGLESSTKLAQEKRELSKLSESNALLLASLGKKERECDVLQQYQTALATQLAEVKEELRVLNTNKATIAVHLRSKEEECRSLQDHQTELTDELEESQNDCARKQTVISRLEVELDAIRLELQQKLDAMLPVRQSNAELTRKVGTLEHENDELSASKAELVKSRAEAMAKLAAKNEECGFLTRSLAETNAKLSAAEARLQKIGSEFGTCQQNFVDKQQAHSDLERMVAQQTEELEHFRKESSRLDEQIKKKEKECNQLTSARESLGAQLSTMEAKLKEISDNLFEKVQECECMKKTNHELEHAVEEQAGRVKRLVDDVSMLETGLSQKELQLTKIVASERKLAASIVEWQMKLKEADALNTKRETEVRSLQKQISEFQIASSLLTTKFQTLSQSMYQKELECKELSELYRQVQNENILAQDQLKDEQATREETARKLQACTVSNASLTQRMTQAGEELAELRCMCEQYRTQVSKQQSPQKVQSTLDNQKSIQDLQKMLIDKEAERRSLFESNKTLTHDLLYSNEQCSSLTKQRSEIAAQLVEKEGEILILQKMASLKNQAKSESHDLKLQEAEKLHLQAEKARFEALDAMNSLKEKVSTLTIGRETMERLLAEKDLELQKSKQALVAIEVQLAQKVAECEKILNVVKPGAGIDHTLQAKKFELENVQTQISLERKSSECTQLLFKQQDLETNLNLTREQLSNLKLAHSNLSGAMQAKDTQILELTNALAQKNKTGSDSVMVHMQDTSAQLTAQLTAQALELKNLNGTRMSLLAQLNSKDLALAEMTQNNAELHKTVTELKSKQATTDIGQDSDSNPNLIELEQELVLETEFQLSSSDSSKSQGLARQLESKEQECQRLVATTQELETKVRQLQVQEKAASSLDQECKRLKKELALANADLSTTTSEVTRLKTRLAQVEDKSTQQGIQAKNAFLKDDEIARERGKLAKQEADLEVREAEVQTGMQNLQVKIQEFNERVRVLNENAKELKKRRESPDDLSIKLAEKEKECAKLRKEAAQAHESGHSANLAEREEAVREAELGIQKGKDELATKVQMYNERVRVLNKATKDLKQKRDQFRRTQGLQDSS